MTGRWLPGFRSVLRGGALPTGIAALLVSPGIPIILTVLSERRLPRLRHDFVAYLIGDPALGVAAAISVAALRTSDGSTRGPRVRAVAEPCGWCLPAFGLGFGIWEWRKDLADGRYSPAQSHAPTRIYHQLITYPTMSYLVGAPVVELLATRPTDRRAVAVAAACGAIWALGLVYDASHPKLGHAPVCWTGAVPRPMAKPWPLASITIRAAAKADAALAPGHVAVL